MTIAKATLAGGCFWCTEAVFRQLDGVLDVVPGYIDGHLPDPDYESVCRGDSGHAEAIEIAYQPDRVAFTTLLQVFFLTHDPTTLNRQGHDIGSQYRSGIYCHTPEQQAAAEASRVADAATLAGATLYSSAEPCAMCAGAVYWCGIGRVVYALSETRLLALTGNHPENPTLALPCRRVLACGQRDTEVLGPVLEDEAADAHHGFWQG